MGCCCTREDQQPETKDKGPQVTPPANKQKTEKIVEQYNVFEEENAVEEEEYNENGRRKEGTPTILGGAVERGGLYKIPDSRGALCLAGEQRTEIPEFANVEIVKKLDISKNKLKILKTSQLSKWENLTQIDLSSNLFQDVPGSIKSLKNLTNLNVSSNPLKKIKEGAPTEPCGVISHLTSLTSLTIQDCKIEQIPKGIYKSTSITDLNVGMNPGLRFSRKGQTSLHNMTALLTLQIPFSSVQAVPEELQGHPTLTSINLTGNLIRDFSSLQKVPHLTEIKLEGCMLGFIPEGILILRGLTSLSLAGNVSIALDGIEKFPCLSNLSLFGCRLPILPIPLLKCSSITSLDLQGNLLNDAALMAFKDSTISESLTELDLCYNPATIGKVGYKAMDAIVLHLKHLTVFSFQKWGDKTKFPEEKNVIYSNKVPARLFGANLTSLNGVPVKEGVFTGLDTMGESMKKTIREGTFGIDLGVEWEDEIKMHVGLLKLFTAAKHKILKNPEKTLKRYKFYLQNVAATNNTMDSTGEELITPPLDVLFFLYIHVTNPNLYAYDLKANDLRPVFHLPYPFRQDSLNDDMSFWKASRVENTNDIFKENSVYKSSAVLWNTRILPVDNKDPCLNYEWFANDDYREAEVGSDSEIELKLDFLDELSGAVEYVTEAAGHAAELTEAWFNGKDRYLKYIVLHMLEKDKCFVPSMGIQTTAHTHQCIPVQYLHAMGYLCNGQYIGLGLPESNAHQAFLETGSLWAEHFEEEYMTTTEVQNEEKMMAHSPRREVVPMRRASLLKNAARLNLENSGTVTSSTLTSQSRVRFLQGSTSSPLIL